MTHLPIIQIWKIKELLKMANEGKLTIFPHQRNLKLKRNCTKTFIETVLLGDMNTPFILGDIESFTHTSNIEDKTFFESYHNLGKVYSIEDCQHRIGSLQLINDDDFNGKFKGRKEEFLEKEIVVYIYKNLSRQELIRKFGRTNSGRPISSSEVIWKVLNSFNNYIKETFVTEKILKLYNVKIKKGYKERIFYGNVIKMLKICASHDNIIDDNSSVSPDNLLNFIENNPDELDFLELELLFDDWYKIIKDKLDADKFYLQSNLYFILFISKKYKINLSEDDIENLLDKFSNTRWLPNSRFNNILKYLLNEKFGNE